MANSFKNTKFRPLGALSNITIGILGIIAVTAVLNILLSGFMILSPDSVIEFENGESVETGWAFIGLVAIVELAARFFCAIFFLIWLYRAYNNLPVLGARHLESSPGWAVGWWFVPFANLVKPFKVVRELYAESHQARRDDLVLGSPPPVSYELIGFWWGTLLGFGFVLRISDRLAGVGDTPASKYFPVWYLTGHILMGISAVLAIGILRNVSRWQEQEFLRTALAGQFAPPPPPRFDEQ